MECLALLQTYTWRLKGRLSKRLRIKIDHTYHVLCDTSDFKFSSALMQYDTEVRRERCLLSVSSAAMS